MLISVPYLGKTVFLFFLLLHRLENRLLTAVQLDADYYSIFDAEGAAFYPAETHGLGLEECWALTDSNLFIQQPSTLFLNRAKCVILMSTPKPERGRNGSKKQ